MILLLSACNRKSELHIKNMFLQRDSLKVVIYIDDSSIFTGWVNRASTEYDLTKHNFLYMTKSDSVILKASLPEWGVIQMKPFNSKKMKIVNIGIYLDIPRCGFVDTLGQKFTIDTIGTPRIEINGIE
jgi:hypothetical protein